MPTQSVPAASLRTVISLPAARVLLRVSNYLICRAFLADRAVDFRHRTEFLPELREAPGGIGAGDGSTEVLHLPPPPYAATAATDPGCGAPSPLPTNWRGRR